MLFRDEEEQQPARQLAESERFLSPSASSTSMTRLVDGEHAPTQTVLELGAEWASGVEFDSNVKVNLMAAGVEIRPDSHFHARMAKPTAQTVGSSSPHIENMVQAGTQAHRLGKGDIVWMTWDEDKQENEREPIAPTRFHSHRHGDIWCKMGG